MIGRLVVEGAESMIGGCGHESVNLDLREGVSHDDGPRCSEVRVAQVREGCQQIQLSWEDVVGEEAWSDGRGWDWGTSIDQEYVS